jgi:hypothetical protein
MKVKSMIRMFSILILAFSLVSCGTQPTPVPTVDTAPTLAAVRTESAATVAAQIAAQASPTPLPATATAISTEVPPTVAPPTAAPTIAQPTVAAVVPTIAYPTVTAAPKATATSVATKYGCEVTTTVPDYKAEFSPRGDFDAKWTLKNTSDTTWDAGNFDIRYVSGTKFQENQDLEVFDLPSSVAAGNSLTVVIDALAPAEPGTYSATWALMTGSTVACNLSINIVVK